jgi:sugar lactone lactonase YvrE
MRVVGEVVSDLGEGAKWDADRGNLAWLDVPRRILYSAEPSGVTQSIALSERVSSIGLTVSGRRYIATTEFGFGFLDPVTGLITKLARVEEPALARMNDGGVDPAGRFYAGSVSINSENSDGRLHYLDAQGQTRCVLNGIRLSNGLAWTKSGDRMYFVDSLRRSLYSFGFDAVTGYLTDRRTVVTFDEEGGIPDGICLDAEDRVWVALWGGGAVRCYAADGKALLVVEVPCRYVTSCAFGGPHLSTLYVTSAANAERDNANAGRLFAVNVGTAGAPIRRFEDSYLGGTASG